MMSCKVFFQTHEQIKCTITQLIIVCATDVILSRYTIYLSHIRDTCHDMYVILLSIAKDSFITTWIEMNFWGRITEV